MSFISVSDTQLARDLWPAGLGRPSSDVSQIKDLPAWRVVPADYEALCQWLCVDREDSSSVPKVLIDPAHHDAERMEMTLRLQGIVTEVNLNPLGNWNGEIEHAPKAVQSLTLTGSTAQDAFNAQTRALANIRELVYKLLALPSPSLHDGHTHGSIVLRRRVFTKVQPSRQCKSALTRQDDPLGRAGRIAHMWCVEHRPVVGLQRDDGTIVRTNPLVIRRGDFVDVAVTVEIFTMRARKMRKTEIFFSPHEVVRLAPAAQITRLFKAPLAPSSRTLTARKPAVMMSGFQFEGPEESMEITSVS